MQALDQASETIQLFAEPTRLRLLALLAEYELTVTELVAILGLGQSRVSTHLGKLRDAGLVRDRRVGTSSYYRLSETIPELPAQLWRLLARDLTDAALAADAEHAREVLAARAGDARWPDLIAGEMERHYSPGRTWEATCRAFAGLLRLGDVLDLGSGDGTIAELLAPRARAITCVDVSPRVAQAAQRRLGAVEHVRCLCADMHALPLPDASFDQVLLLNALACAHDPQRALCEASRVLRPGGELAIVTLDSHEQIATVTSYGHVQPGFAPSALTALLLQAGLRVTACAVSSRERRSPRFGVVTAFAEKPSDRSRS
jgi:DNA-binding transcriptional ArsR family regulator/protein-L-isoaspartate O-methyltransferase